MAKQSEQALEDNLIKLLEDLGHSFVAIKDENDLFANLKGQLGGLALTPANIHDAQMMPNILNKYTKVAVGDGGYTAAVMKKRIWETYGTLVVSPPHFKQDKKLITWWQYRLLTIRPKIESVFDYLKEHLHLVSSFPRSVIGYLLHYIRIILAYQIMAIS